MNFIILCIIIALILFLSNLFFMKFGGRIGQGMAKKHMDKWGMNYSDEEGKQ